MATLEPEALRAYDSLYVSPRAADALLSCAARIHAERAKGLRVLVLALFEGAAFARGAAAEPILEGLGVDFACLRLPGAVTRHPAGGSPAPSRVRSNPEDDAVRDEATRLLVDLRPRLRPRHVYAPLGVGGQVDHGIASDAALAAFGQEAGRNVFLYEDRPEALVVGEVRLRLGHVGARLPAEAVRTAERGSLARHLWQGRDGARARGLWGGFWAELGATRAVFAGWREARAWSPQKAFGPRLQPLVPVVDSSSSSFAQTLVPALVSEGALGARVTAQTTAYVRRLGGDGRPERYWLLLPRLDGLHQAERVSDPAIS